MQFKKKKDNVSEVDMTPMIDIVFQLIAFFMVITNFEQTQADERVKLPKDQLAKPPEVKRETELVINIGYLRNLQGEKTDPQPYVFYGGDTIRIANFGDKMKQEYRIAPGDPKEMTIVIRADAETPTGLVQEIIKQSQEAGFEKFALKATQKTDP